MTEPTDEHPLKDLKLQEPDAYIDEIDAMSLEELEARLPEAQEALEAIEAKLEELMGLRDAALVCAAAMSARLAALKQTGGQPRQEGQRGFFGGGYNPPSAVGANQHPNPEDYKLPDGTTYLHLDGSNTIGQTSTGDDNETSNDPRAWGQEKFRLEDGRFSVFEKELNNKNKKITHVFWTEERAKDHRGKHEEHEE